MSTVHCQHSLSNSMQANWKEEICILTNLLCLSKNTKLCTILHDSACVAVADQPTCEGAIARPLSCVFCRSEAAAEGRPEMLHTRSNWLRQQAMGLSMRSLHSEARKRLGTSIPAHAFPLIPGDGPDLDAKPERVVLYFGIIDFLQVRPPSHQSFYHGC